MPITFRITDPASCRWAVSPLRARTLLTDTLAACWDRLAAILTDLHPKISWQHPILTIALARRCTLPNSTVSEHLTILRDAGLITTHRTGRYLQHTRTPPGTQLAAQ